MISIIVSIVINYNNRNLDPILDGIDFATTVPLFLLEGTMITIGTHPVNPKLLIQIEEPQKERQLAELRRTKHLSHSK